MPLRTARPVDVIGKDAAVTVRLPNTFVVGAAKAGTTSIWHYLRQHPDVFVSPVKEPHFYSRGGMPGASGIKDPDAYSALFAEARDELVVAEASPSYLWDPETPHRVLAASPEARIIVSLREPVGRAHSHYLTHLRSGLERRTFLDAARAELEAEPRIDAVPPPYVARGRYPEQLARWLDAFGDRVLVVFFEEFTHDARAVMRDTFAFLGVDADVSDRLDVSVHNAYKPSRGRRRLLRRQKRAKPPLDREARQILEEVYRPLDPELERLVGRPLPWTC